MSTTYEPQIDIRRADARFKTRIGWLDSKHSFSFSRHYDPDNTHHGLLLVNNDDIVAPGPGFAQRMSAGTGILHSEKNDSWRHQSDAKPHADPVRLVQMWVLPDEGGIK